jgi:hypothetical protein
VVINWYYISGYYINGYWCILVAILLMAIGGYSIVNHWWLFYWWLLIVATLLWESEDEIHTLEMGIWESSGILKSSKFDCKGQNTLYWGIHYIIGKLSKCRCPNWARITHLDIWNTSYGLKKGQESNWQFDFRPRKVRNRPDSLACKWLATRRWKALDEGYNFGLDLVSIGAMH